MVSIPLSEGTVTLHHEWPVHERAEAYARGEAVVSLEVDTEVGTAVVALTHDNLMELAWFLDEFGTYYDKIEEDEWNSR